jgi:uncharacterized protein (DUF2062 family)
MVFARRDKLPLHRSVMHAVWPRSGWKRTLSYFWKRLGRLSATPYAIAIGGAAGTFAAFSPFVGFHIVIAVALAYLLRGSLIAAAFCTLLANPLTIPVIWAATYETGSWVLSGGDDPISADHAGRARPATGAEDFFAAGLEAVWPVLKPMLVGSIPLGLLAAMVSYVVLAIAVRGMQERRRQRLADRVAAGDEGGTP